MLNRIHIVVLLLLITLAPAAQSQEGHPLVGTWQGNWGDDNALLTVIMTWDGQRISGIVNPGPGSTELDSAILDSSQWSVALAMPVTDSAGNSSTFMLDGTLNNVGSRMRSLTGTWRYLGRSGPITLGRQNGQ